ncbi:hypothetical protein B0H66DRAFT_307146 [Apodospora peruviana]|uniref:Uncharacterized protein n=1 Tax=Apodospora peruviana TaxID=516989 RepID=A0AAE0I2C6_9PEZI|nr:hypothetical protein B0H66DRAFT_307146 [Apodospora peruviana]
MEVVGFVAAVASIAKVAQTAANFAGTIYDVAKHAGTVGNRIKRQAWLFESFDTAIRSAELSLEYRCPRNLDSPVIQYMVRHAVLDGLKLHSERIRDDIRTRRVEIWSIVSKIDFVTSWKWNRIKPGILELQPQMESMKATFTMVLHVIMIEILVTKNKDEPSEEKEKEIEFLKRVVEEQAKTIRHLVKERHIGQAVANDTKEASRSSISPRSVDEYRVICHLAQSFVETETVPTAPPEEFSFKEMKRRQRRRRNSAAFPGDNPRPPHTPEQRTRPASSPVSAPVLVPVPVPASSPTPSRSSRRSHRQRHEYRLSPRHQSSSTKNAVELEKNDGHARRETTRDRYIIQGGTVIIPSAPQHAHANEEASERNAEQGSVLPLVVSASDPMEQPTAEPSSTALGKRPEKNSLPSVDPQPAFRVRPEPATVTEDDSALDPDSSSPETPSPNTPNAEEFIFPTAASSSSSSSNRHQSKDKLPAGGGKITTSNGPVIGYLVNSTGRHRFEAQVDRQLTGNLITAEYAVQLGLKVSSHGPYYFIYNKTELHSVGRVSLNWSTKPTNTLVEPAEISCFVCEKLEYPLIFGSWFSKAQRHMLREEEREV